MEMLFPRGLRGFSWSMLVFRTTLLLDVVAMILDGLVRTASFPHLLARAGL